jgi:hypothetical protein
MSKPDQIEVSRKAHEISQTHGPTAFNYAVGQPQRAADASDEDEQAFWKAVAARLRIR